MDHGKVVPITRSTLLIFDINKVLVSRRSLSTQYKIRPFVKEFLIRISKLFTIAVWTSARKKSVVHIINELFHENGVPLAFQWYQEKCTEIHQDDSVVLVKDLAHVWRSFPRFNSSNTILIDDSTEKCIFNPKHTSIHPQPFIAFQQGSSLRLAGSGFSSARSFEPVVCCVPGLLESSGGESEDEAGDEKGGEGEEEDEELRPPSGRLFTYLLRLHAFNGVATDRQPHDPSSRGLLHVPEPRQGQLFIELNPY